MSRSARRSIWRTTLSAILLLMVPGGASARQLTIFLTSGIAGQLERADGTNVAALVKELKQQAEKARADGHDVVILDGGRTVAPYAESGFDQGQTIMEVLEAAGHQAFIPTFVDFTLGVGELAERRGQVAFPIIRPFVVDPAKAAAVEKKIAATEKKLSDAERRAAAEQRAASAAELLAAVDKLETVAILEPGDDLKVLVASVFKPLPEEDFGGTGLEKVRMLAPGEAFEGHDSDSAVRIAIAHKSTHGRNLTSHEMTWEMVEQPRGIDLVIHPNFGYQVTLRRETDQGPVFLAGLIRDPKETWRVWRLDLDLERHGAGWGIRSVTTEALPALPPNAPEEPAIAAVVKDTMDRFRDRFAVPLPPGAAALEQVTSSVAALRRQNSKQAAAAPAVPSPAKAPQPSAAPEGAKAPGPPKASKPKPAEPSELAKLERFVLEAAREAAGTEIAIISRGALRLRSLGEGPLTQEAVVRLLSLDQRLAITRLLGSELQELINESAKRVDDNGELRNDGLCFLGLNFECGDPPPRSLRVNNRGLQPGDLYRVVTTTYLITGGDSYPALADRFADGTARLLPAAVGGPLKGVEPASTAGVPTLELRRDVVLPRLAKDKLNVKFPNLNRKVLYRYGIDKISLTVQNVETERDRAYIGVDSRAGATDNLTLRGDLDSWLHLEWVGWKMENTFKVNFGLVNQEGRAPRETNDEASFESGFAYFKKPFLGAYPYVGFRLDTELRRNEDFDPIDRVNVALPRKLELSLGTGLVWQARQGKWHSGRRTNWRRIRFGVFARNFVEEEINEGTPEEPEFIVNRVTEDMLGAVFSGRWARPAGKNVPGLDGEFYFDYARNSDFNLRRIDVEFALLFPVWGNLSLTPSFNYYQLTDSRLPGSADYFQYSIGLRYNWLSRFQTGTVPGPKPARPKSQKKRR